MPSAINYYLVESNEDGKRISTAFEEARATKRPVAVLIGDEYHGFQPLGLRTAIALTTASDTHVRLQEEYDDLCSGCVQGVSDPPW
jgi:hypothetical protein